MLRTRKASQKSGTRTRLDDKSRQIPAFGGCGPPFKGSSSMAEILQLAGGKRGEENTLLAPWESLRLSRSGGKFLQDS